MKDVFMAEESTERKPKKTSEQVTNHLANERTFLAWIRTGLSTVTIGFVVARFGLFLRELGVKSTPVPLSSLHYSMLFGVALTILGIIAIVGALINFLLVRRSIDSRQYHPSVSLPIVLTVVTTIIGVLLAIYLALTS